MSSDTTPIRHEAPTYEGRRLPNPEEEVVDQGLQFDVTTLFTRRRMLGVLGIGAGTALLAACGADPEATSSTTSSSTTTSSDLVEIPEETNGPYPADGTNGVDILDQSGIVRSDIRSSFGDSTTTAEGVPFTFTMTVIDMDGGNVPFAGAAVYLWQCDAAGLYSMYSEGIEGENYLRGVQIADADGKVTFTSIFPACYMGRWPHLHFEVYPDVDSITDHDNVIATSQGALPEAACNEVYDNDSRYSDSVRTFSQITLDSDNVFGDDGAAEQMVDLTGDRANGYVGTLTVAIDTTTEPGVSAGGGGGEPPSGGGGGEPPSGGDS